MDSAPTIWNFIAILFVCTVWEASCVPGVAWLRSRPNDPPHLIKLWRVGMRGHGGKPLALKRSFYVGRMSIGHSPLQELAVTFDTASGQVVLPSTKCKDPACLQHRRYSAAHSQSMIDINIDGTLVEEGHRLVAPSANRDSIGIGFSSAELGDGKVTGELVYDTICVGIEGKHRTCTKLGLVAAKEMTEVPFRDVPQDGIVGLGLAGLSINPLFSYIGRLAANSGVAQPRFGIYLGSHGGELALGGVNQARLALPMSWASVVHLEEGYWQVAIKSVRIGNQTVATCSSGCRGIVDSCASQIGVPARLFPNFKEALSGIPRLHEQGSGCGGRDMHLELDGFTLTLKEKEYADEDCNLHMMPLQLPEDFAGVFILGEPVLRKYYTSFDWDAKKVGFGLAVESRDEMEEMVMAPAFGEEAVTNVHSITLFLKVAIFLQITMLLVPLLARRWLASWRLQLARVRLALARMGMTSSSGAISWVPPEDVPAGDECVICLGSCEEDSGQVSASNASKMLRLSGPRPSWCRLRCGHHFHQNCIFEWLQKVQRCPVCRCEFQENQKPCALDRH